MQTEIIISGFGGQGVLFAGQLLAYAAMEQSLQVTWIPSYGPEMRGGTANCTVIISDEEIGSPVVGSPKVVLALNLPSLDKYEPLVKAGGLLIVNASMVDRAPQRTDIQTVMIPASEIAESLGDKRMANMVMLGALLGNLPILPEEAIAKVLREHTTERMQKLLSANLEALRRGMNYLVEKVK
ncbi:MAG: 2-oxoacid:acceptor oxidoreductase family protein [Anaerolineales bacterium]